MVVIVPPILVLENPVRRFQFNGLEWPGGKGTDTLPLLLSRMENPNTSCSVLGHMHYRTLLTDPVPSALDSQTILVQHSRSPILDPDRTSDNIDVVHELFMNKWFKGVFIVCRINTHTPPHPLCSTSVVVVEQPRYTSPLILWDRRSLVGGRTRDFRVGVEGVDSSPGSCPESSVLTPGPTTPGYNHVWLSKTVRMTPLKVFPSHHFTSLKNRQTNKQIWRFGHNTNRR